MIRRPISGLHICLRCQFRLNRVSTTIPHRTIRASSSDSPSPQADDGSSAVGRPLSGQRSERDKIGFQIKGESNTTVTRRRPSGQKPARGQIGFQIDREPDARGPNAVRRPLLDQNQEPIGPNAVRRPLLRQNGEPDATEVPHRRWARSKDRPFRTSATSIGDPDTPKRDSDTLKTYLSEHPLGRLHGNGNTRETHASLEVKSLGKKAEVIMFRETEFTPLIKEPHNDIENGKPKEDVDILSLLSSERGVLSDTEIASNINDFKPKEEGSIQTWPEFIEVVQLLESGFTFGQLNRYIKTAENRWKTLPSLIPEFITGQSPIARVSPWMPETSKSGDAFDESTLRGYISPSFTSKQAMALKLMRECWHIELPEITEGIGEVEIQLRPVDLELLIKQGFLSAVSQSYVFGEDEKIEAFRKRDVVRITSHREKSALIIREMEDALHNVSRVDIPLRPIFPKSRTVGWEKKHLTVQVLRSLGQLTDTEIAKASVGGEAVATVSCIDYNPAIKTSKRHEVARRLLLNATPIGEPESIRIELQASAHEQAATYLKYQGMRDLPWHQKLRSWHRWTSATPKNKRTDQQPNDNEGKPSTANEAVPNHPIHNAIIGNANDKFDIMSGGFQEPVTPNNENPNSGDGQAYWDPGRVIDVSAIVGQVLHNFPQSRPVDAKSLEALKKPEVLHTFSYNTLNVTTMMRSTPLIYRSNETLLMRFKPNPWGTKADGKTIGAAALTAFPLIEMRFAIDPGTYAVQLRTVRAINSTHTSDLMLPDSRYDLRFQRKVATHMVPMGKPHESTSQFSPAIDDFLARCNLDLKSNLPLETPAGLRIPISEHVCAQNPHPLGDESQDGNMSDVEYLFAGLEYHNNMMLDFNGWELSYTSIEAGKAGGSRSELRLLPVRTDFTPPYEKAFMESAYQLVDLLDTEKPNISRIIPRESETNLLFTNTPGVEGRFKFHAYRPSDFVQRVDRRNKRQPAEVNMDMGQTIKQADEEWEESTIDENSDSRESL